MPAGTARSRRIGARDVGRPLAARLLATQHPDLADLTLGRSTRGWSHTVVRLGRDLAVRLPHRAPAHHHLINEPRALEALADLLPVATPRVVRTGRPAPDLAYPWPWTVVRWVHGTVADRATADGATLADDLACLLRALHQVAPDDLAPNPDRAGPVSTRLGAVADRLHRPGLPDDLRPDLLADVVARIDHPWSSSPRWVHGDLHPRNLVVRHGRLAGVLDFGDAHAGDPALDLLPAWMALAASDRPRLRAGLPHVDAATWRRGRAWAVHLSAILATERERHLRRIGLATLRAVQADLVRPT